MGEKIDQAKGRAKEAAGSITGDKHLKREGKVERTAGEVEGKVEGTVDAVKDKVKTLGRDATPPLSSSDLPEE